MAKNCSTCGGVSKKASAPKQVITKEGTVIKVVGSDLELVVVNPDKIKKDR